MLAVHPLLGLYGIHNQGRCSYGFNALRTIKQHLATYLKNPKYIVGQDIGLPVLQAAVRGERLPKLQDRSPVQLYPPPEKVVGRVGIEAPVEEIGSEPIPDNGRRCL